MKTSNKWLAKIPKKKEWKSKSHSSSRVFSRGIHQVVSGTNIDVEKPSKIWVLRGWESKQSVLGFDQGIGTSLSDME